MDHDCPLTPDPTGGPHHAAEPAPSPARTALLALKRFVALIGTILLFVLAQALGSLPLTYALDCMGPLYDLDGCVGELLALLAIAAVWARMARPRFIDRRRLGKRSPRELAQGVSGLVLLGLGIQFGVTICLILLFTAYPAIGEVYEAMVPSHAETGITVFSFVSTAILAPLVEEIMLRGIGMELLFRAGSPTWRPGRQAPAPGRGTVAVVIAVQAVVFGVAHLVPVQVAYASVIGIVLGWVCWRTGDLRYSILVHMVVNASNFLPIGIDSESPLAMGSWAAGAVVLLIVGAMLFRRATARRGETAPATE